MGLLRHPIPHLSSPFHILSPLLLLLLLKMEVNVRQGNGGGVVNKEKEFATESGYEKALLLVLFWAFRNVFSSGKGKIMHSWHMSYS